jgi:hypothetical protein
MNEPESRTCSIQSLQMIQTCLPQRPTCHVTAKVAKKGRVSFDANVSGTNGKLQCGLGGDHEKPGKGASGVALCYHKFDEFKLLPKDQQDELIE